ncbi:MAG: DUF1549 domain-containing protein [Gemmataceae bacterium]
MPFFLNPGPFADPPQPERVVASRWPLVVLKVAILGVAGLLIGAFVLPHARNAAPPPAPEAVPVPVVSAPIPPPPPKPESKPAPPPARSAHPLDAAPNVVHQRPGGPAGDLANRIDAIVDAALAKKGVPASPMADDAEFLRRVSLDLTGSIPSYDATARYLLSGDPLKRAKLIDELLDSPAYGRHFARIWADLLVKRDFDSNKNLKTDDFTTWLAGEFNANAGWDKTVKSLLTASGPAESTPQALFYLANQDNNQPSPAKLVGATGNLFLGVQIQCAECHVHPQVDKWSQKDFWGLAAFFGHVRAERDTGGKGQGPATIHEVERKAEPKAKDKAAKKNGDKAIEPGAVIRIPDPTDNKKTVGTAPAKFFEGTAPKLAAVPYRPALADWVASPKNRYFAPATVNRLWAHLFARGLVHPVEEMHPANTASHPEALSALADAFAASGYDIKSVLRALCNTQAYQRTSRPLADNASDAELLSHMPVKVLGARELLDSLVVATGVQERSSGRDALTKKAGPPGKGGDARPAVRFFDTREYDDDPTEYAYGVPQILKLMNTGLTNRTNEVGARVARAASGDKRRAVEDLFVTALGRRPRADELDRMLAYVAGREPAKGYAGVFWALLNSAEFVSNH